jgi:predicted O-methyltransferase YrrM
MFATSNEKLAEFMESREWGPRKEQFAYLCDRLLSLNHPVIIIETGCMRPNELPWDDGQSTLIWDWVVNQVGGQVFSVDINQENVIFTENLVSKKTQVIRADSLQYLSCLMPPMPYMIDMVYLDSHDWKGDALDKMESALHHAGELAAIWKHIAPGGIIAVDDCVQEYEGKQAVIEAFFNILRVPAVMTGGICAWLKPVRAL